MNELRWVVKFVVFLTLGAFSYKFGMEGFFNTLCMFGFIFIGLDVLVQLLKESRE